jgi:probable HAF family extracellular repeat protein
MNLNRRFVTALLSAVLTVLALATLALPAFAQSNSQQKPNHHQYKLYDFGTFGGPSSYASEFAVTVTGAGAVATSDTSLADPFNPTCFIDCFVSHSALLRNGQLTDIGALPGNSGLNSSFAAGINGEGLVVGGSETGAIDPSTGYPEVHAYAWQGQTMSDLGTFGGTQSFANMVNNRGQVIGSALNDVPDPYSYGTWFPGTTQAHGFVWDKGVLQDLGTLGGPDTYAYIISNSGKIAGTSYINNNPSPITGVPSTHPFLWDNGKMIDLGSYGGDISGVWDVNNKGQVVGYMFYPGDQTWRALFSDNGVLIDPGDLGGQGSYLGWLNDAGDAAVGSFLSDHVTVHTTLWSKGQLSDIGSVGHDMCAQAIGINSRLQIVGLSEDRQPSCVGSFDSDARGFLWEGGGPMVDLNPLIENPSGLHVYQGLYISDSGQIYAQAVDAQSNNHVVLLVPDGSCGSECDKRVSESMNWKPNPLQHAAKIPANLAAVAGMGRYNSLADPLERHHPNIKSDNQQ